MNNFKIVACHPGIGTVGFIIEASDSKAAFSVWKNVVGSPRQWHIVSNEPDQPTLINPAVLMPVGTDDVDDFDFGEPR